MAQTHPSERQLRLLALHSGGMTIPQLAKLVYLSESMVKYEFDRLKETLGARNLYHAQVLALAGGYLEIDGREACLFVPDAALDPIVDPVAAA